MNNQLLTHKYSDDLHAKTIMIIGPYPPPLGGVSIHIKRVKAKLEKQDNVVHVHNTAKKYTSKLASFFSLAKKLLSTRPNLVYHHEPTESVQKLAISVVCKYLLRYKLVVVDHDCRVLYRFAPWKKSFLKFLLKKADRVVVIGDTTDACYRDNGVSPLQNCAIESPFLPPDLGDEKKLLKQFSPSVHNFLQTRTPLISANAFAPVWIDCDDLYGFDMCIEMVDELRKTHPKVGVIFGICKIETPEQKTYFAKIQERIKRSGLVDHFYFFTNKPEFWPLIKKSDLFVRPTTSDSFGISVQEAISLGTPAIASNVCIRPTGSILFEPKNRDDFIDKVKQELSQGML